jgi:hypothetical protein
MKKNKMKKFLFVTPLTPSKLLTPLRSKLYLEFIRSLNNQSYAHWQALLIGEEEKQDGNITYAKVKAESKEIKLIFAKEFIFGMDKKPDYIIRIDDDDVINPRLLERLSNMDFDCYADKFHTFYDVSSGKICQKEKGWLANTVVHKFEHSMAEIGEDKLPLLNCDHGKEWYSYYKDRKLVFAPKNHPVYLRVLSPTTVTSGIHNSTIVTIHDKYEEFKSKVVNLKKESDIDFKLYHNYLKGFGKWKYKDIKDFTNSIHGLDHVWEEFSGQKRNDNYIKKVLKQWNSLVD